MTFNCGAYLKSKKIFVYQQFVVHGKTDNSIALALGVTRSAVTHLRKYFEIQRPKLNTGELGEKLTIAKMRSLGFLVKDMNSSKNKLHPFDLLIDVKTRVDVKTANRCIDGRWRFTLTNRPENGNAESDRVIKLKNGRMKKVLTKSCDYLVLCALDGKKKRFYAVPTYEIPADFQTITLSEEGKWSIWCERWDLIKSHNAEEVIKTNGNHFEARI